MGKELQENAHGPHIGSTDEKLRQMTSEAVRQAVESCEVSLFDNCQSTLPKAVRLHELWKNIVENQAVKRNTTIVRGYHQAGDKDGYDKHKRKDLPAFTVAARFEGGRRASCLVAYTQLEMVDLDKISSTERLEEAWEKVVADPHTLMAHRTPSGCGLRIIARVEGVKDPLTHLQAWTQVNEYYAGVTGIGYDPQTKDASRLSIVCHDAEAIFRPEAEVLEVAYGQLEEQKPANGKRKAGRPPKSRAEKQWTVVKKRLTEEGIAYEEGSRNSYISRTAYMMNRYGIPQGEATAWAGKQFADYGTKEAADIFNNVYANHADEHAEWLEGTEKSNGGQLLIDIQECIGQMCTIRYNEIKGRNYIRWTGSASWTELTDRDTNKLWHDVSVAMSKSIKKQIIIQEIENPDFSTGYNPFVEYLESLTPWQPGDTDYFALIAGMIEVKEKEHYRFALERAIAKWTVNVVACWLEPDVKNECILALLGPQNCGKTTFFEQYFPPELREYTTTQSNISFKDRDERALLAEYGFILLDELDHHTDRMFQLIKSTTSTRHVSDRTAYARYNQQRPRIASFAATGNNTCVLPEDNNRRWLVYEVEHVSKERFNIPHAGLWAQAYACYKSGFDFRLTDEEVLWVEQQNKRFRQPDLLEEAFLSNFRIPENAHDVHCNLYSTHDVLKIINSSHQLKNITPKQLGNTLQRLGCKRKSVRGGKKGYELILLPPTTTYVMEDVI